MGTSDDRATRIAADLMESAASEGARLNRSPRKQLEHWARVGRALSSQQEAASRRRVKAALSGEVPLGELDVDEGVAFNAEIQAAIEERLAETDYGKALADRGFTTVALDQNNQIVEYRPEAPA